MNVLQVTPYSVHPPSNGGDHRMHGLMLGRRQDDTVQRFAKGSYSADRTENPVEISDGYREFRYTSFLESVPMHLTGKITDVPSIYTSWVMAVTRPKKLHELVKNSDIVVVEHPWQFKYVDEISGSDTPVVYSSHNFEPELYEGLQQSLYSSLFYNIIAKLEQIAVSRSALTVVTCQRDQNQYERVFDDPGPFYVAPNAAYQPAPASVGSTMNPPASLKQNFSTCFVGSDHAPNIDAVELILSYAEQLPNVEFFIIGSVCKQYTGESLPDNVHLEGFVESLDGYYQACDVALNPVRTGSGSNVKMPEYFAHGLPVVTTPFGARGIEGVPGVHYVECESNEFTDAIKALQTGTTDTNTIGENARELVETTLNWRTVSEGFFDRLRKLNQESINA